MQTLPVITAASTAAMASSAPPAAEGNGASQAAESFGSVLAKQRAHSSQDGSQSREGGAPSGPSATDTQASGDATAALQAAIPNAPVLPGDVLAALLPATAAVNGADAAQNDAQPQTAESAGILPGDALAALIPAALAAAHAAVGEPQTSATQQEPGKDGLAAQQSTAFAGPGATMPLVAHKGAPAATESAASPAIAGLRKEDLPQAPAAAARGREFARTEPSGAGKEKSFSAELERLGKEDGLSQSSALSAARLSARAEESAATDNLAIPQGMAAPAASLQNNGTAQAVQAAINTPVTHEAWGEEFGQKITWMATQHEQSAELHLNPPNLGPLDVVLNVSGDQATALFTSPHAAVRDAVEQALPRLRDMLADSGITLGNAMVSDQSPQERQAWQAEQQKGNGGNRGVESIAGEAPAIRIQALRHHQGLVDTFA